MSISKYATFRSLFGMTAVLLLLLATGIGFSARASAEPFPRCTGSKVYLSKKTHPPTHDRWLHSHTTVKCNAGVDKIRLALKVQEHKWWGWKTLKQDGKNCYNRSSGWKKCHIVVNSYCSSGSHKYRAYRYVGLYNWIKKYHKYLFESSWGRYSKVKTYHC